jgi:hypothetical protein
MKKNLFFVFLRAVSVCLWAQVNLEFFTDSYWYIEKSDTVYEDWYVKGVDPHGLFHKFDIPQGCTIYRRRLRNERFYYLYQADKKDKIFYVEIAKDSDGNDLEFNVTLRNNNSYLSIRNGYRLYDSGNRDGGIYDPEHPLVGIWGKLPLLFEIRLVKPDNYSFYLEIPDEMPGYAVRHGTYLFKQISNTVFETDSSFPDGHMRLEIKNQDWLILTPLFTLPNEKGRVQPLYMRRYPMP